MLDFFFGSGRIEIVDVKVHIDDPGSVQSRRVPKPPRHSSCAAHHSGRKRAGMDPGKRRGGLLAQYEFDRGCNSSQIHPYPRAISHATATASRLANPCTPCEDGRRISLGRARRGNIRGSRTRILGAAETHGQRRSNQEPFSVFGKTDERGGTAAGVLSQPFVPDAGQAGPAEEVVGAPPAKRGQVTTDRAGLREGHPCAWGNECSPVAMGGSPWLKSCQTTYRGCIGRSVRIRSFTAARLDSALRNLGESSKYPRKLLA